MLPLESAENAKGGHLRKVGKLAVLGLTALGLALAGPADNSLIVGASQEPRVLAGDFLGVISTQAIKAEIENYLFVPFITLNLDGQNTAVLATEVPTIQNGRVRFTDIGQGRKRLEIDITIRPDARWSDGRPITTEDVQFYFEVGKAKGMPVYTVVRGEVVMEKGEVREDARKGKLVRPLKR
jgi:peptide/nickel transport system substrate-binding protein